MQEFKILEEMSIILCYFICKQVLTSTFVIISANTFYSANPKLNPNKAYVRKQ